MNIYVGNLSNDVNEEDLREAFESYGDIKNVNLMKDRYSGLTRGFAFIEMSTNEEGKAAIEGLNGKELKGKSIRVNEAIPRDENRSGGQGGFRGGNRQGGNRGGRNNNRGGGGYGKRW